MRRFRFFCLRCVGTRRFMLGGFLSGFGFRSGRLVNSMGLRRFGSGRFARRSFPGRLCWHCCSVKSRSWLEPVKAEPYYCATSCRCTAS